MKFSLTTLILLAFLAYVLNAVYVIYQLFHVPACKGSSRKCLHPHQLIDEKLEVAVYTSSSQQANSRNLKLLWKNGTFSLSELIRVSINVSLPQPTRNNGSLFAFVFIYPLGRTPFGNYLTAQASAPLTTFAIPQSQSINLLSSDGNEKRSDHDVPVTHWKPKLTFHVLAEKIVFERRAIPGEIFPLISVAQNEKYLPIVYIDQLQVIYRYLKLINTSSEEMPLEIEYSPISLGKLRMWTSIFHSLKTMRDLGFSDKDLDDVRGIFTDTNLYLLGLTFAISALHLLFDVLAFKNDIHFWRNRDTVVGLSGRAVVWRSISSLIIFLYLMDEKASLLVTVPSGIGAVIEVWKVKKVLKLKFKWENGARPTFEFAEKTSEEKETESFDSEAVRYLSYVLYPLLFCGAVYTLIYHTHKSWYSWVINCLVNGVYAFGFLFMLPQLFVNYKMKSVAHLPWRAFMYKAFNTFIDDVFAFIIHMPTAHRLACFRDDLVFVVYLYQRWLYPVDMKRVNEFGVSYEEKSGEEKPHKD